MYNESEKPIKRHPIDSMYVYNEVIKYLEGKYSFNSHDVGGKYDGLNSPGVPYENFWHWVIDNHDLINGSVIEIDTNPEENKDEDLFVRMILSYIHTEFSNDGVFTCWVEW